MSIKLFFLFSPFLVPVPILAPPHKIKGYTAPPPTHIPAGHAPNRNIKCLNAIILLMSVIKINPEVTFLTYYFESKKGGGVVGKLNLI